MSGTIRELADDGLADFYQPIPIRHPLIRHPLILQKNRPRNGGGSIKNQNTTVSYLAGESFILPSHTFLPWILLTRNMIPTVMKKNGPVKPKSATYLVP